MLFYGSPTCCASVAPYSTKGSRNEGFRRLGSGKLIGTRTWGGEIWLTASNVLADRGIATAAGFGVYGPDGKWLIEGMAWIPTS